MSSKHYAEQELNEMGAFFIVNNILVRKPKEDKQLAQKWTLVIIKHRDVTTKWIIENVEKSTSNKNIFIPSQLLKLLENKPFVDEMKQPMVRDTCSNCVQWQNHVQEQRKKIKDNESIVQTLTSSVEMYQAEITYFKSMSSKPSNVKEHCYQLLKKWGMKQYSTILIETHGWDDFRYWKCIPMQNLMIKMKFLEGHAFKFKMESEKIQ